VVQGALLLVAALSIPRVLDQVPLAPLAVILIYIGYRLAHPRLVVHIWRQGPAQFIPFAVTVVAILLTNLLLGIAIGLAVGLLFVFSDGLRTSPFTVVSPPGGVLTRLRLHKTVSFLNKAALAETLEAMAPGSRVEIDGRGCERIDHDVLELIHEFRETARLRGIDYRLVGIPAEAIMPSA
jgi:MFS superfamily sulfate permease-like transporter